MTSVVRSPGAAYVDEAVLQARWAAGVRSALRLEDGRALRVIFPGVPGGSSGPDFRGAILEAGGDLLRGDVEIHLRASGWRAHGHASDPAYGGVVLHVVAVNDTGTLTTLHAGGRAIPVAVLRAGRPAAAFPPPFTPPCALEVARGRDPSPVLARLSERRLRIKAARIAPLVGEVGMGQALYVLSLEHLGGAANRAAFASLARRLPLDALLEARGEHGPIALAAALKHGAARVALRRAGLRPMAAPGARLEAASLLIHRLWPPSARGVAWPASLVPGALPRALRVHGLGRETAIELALNAVLPVALAGGAWSEADALVAWHALPSPGTYGKLHRLESWTVPLARASALQGALLLHADYCTKGMCGRCPLSDFHRTED